MKCQRYMLDVCGVCIASFTDGYEAALNFEVVTAVMPNVLDPHAEAGEFFVDVSMKSLHRMVAKGLSRIGAFELFALMHAYAPAMGLRIRDREGIHVEAHGGAIRIHEPRPRRIAR